jgi:hypothetical protein
VNIKDPEKLTVQLPPVRVSESLDEALRKDLEEDNAAFKAAGGRTDGKLSGHIRWILEKYIADKKAKR